MATILEALQNARINLIENRGTMIAEMIGREQLNNAITLLEKGYSIDTEIEPLTEPYESIDEVPEA